MTDTAAFLIASGFMVWYGSALVAILFLVIAVLAWWNEGSL